MEPIYKLLDQIYCINLISRPDRYSLMKEFEAEEKINITFHRPKKNVISGRIGCFTSHLNCVHDAFKKNHSYIMIFEDDVIKTKYYDKIDYEQIKNFILTNKSWEILKFSSTTTPIQMLQSNEYSNIYNGPTLLGTAYVLNKKGINKIISTFTNHIQKNHLDVYYSEIFKKTTWNVLPIPFDQRWDMGSDNTWEWTLSSKNQEYIRNILNYNVFYYTSLIKYYNSIIKILIIVILVLYIIKWEKSSK